MYRSKVCVQELSYFVSGLDIQLEKSEYVVLSTTALYAKNLVAGGEIQRVVYRFFREIDTNQWFVSMAEWLRLVTESRATWVRFLMSANLLQRLGHFAWH